MDFLELTRKRYACRKYRPGKVEKEKMDYILECARNAPSAVNFQPCRFMVVRSEEQKELLHQCYDREWFRTAPLYIVVCTDESVAWTRKSDGKNHADIDAAIAAEHICLAAADAGLGSCWVCNFDAERFRMIFRLPASVHPVVFIPLGYADGECDGVKDRKPVEELVTVL